jgi:predicted nucleic acid-binding protein
MKKERNINIPASLFVDTWGWCIIANPKEEQHLQAKQIIEARIEPTTHLITTNFVLDETYTLVRSRVHHQASVELHQKIELLISNRSLKVVYINPEIEKVAWKIFEKYSDKDFSFTDCTSFVVMQMLKLTHAFTDDHHFEQMGFQIIF